jgi:predicted Zn-dependent peptidase
LTDALDPVVEATRPTPGHPRPYQFPAFERATLANGLDVVTVHLPGRPLISAQLLLRNGAADEPRAEGGATVLSARALTEGTERYDAIALVEATERLGATLHADASWDSYMVGIEVPATRLARALELLAEVVAHPTFPEAEVERIRDERLNDILQARADARRRVEEAFNATIYQGESPYHRPSAGTRATVEPLDRVGLERAWARGVDPARMTLVVAGDLDGVEPVALAERLMSGWTPAPGAITPGPISARASPGGRRLRLVDKPGAPQTEIRVGHVGVPRRIPDFHALSVLGAILGGLFNSRLNMKLREEKGYTYGAHAGFDLRRAAGPFSARAAVNTEVTAAALSDLVAELERIRSTRVTEAELRAARDYLIGVFPLRFETPGPIVQALTGMIVHDLPDDELATYRQRIDAVTVDDILAAAQAHIDVDSAVAVLVGDAAVIASSLEVVGFGPVEVIRDDEELTEP